MLFSLLAEGSLAADGVLGDGDHGGQGRDVGPR